MDLKMESTNSFSKFVILKTSLVFLAFISSNFGTFQFLTSTDENSSVVLHSKAFEFLVSRPKLETNVDVHQTFLSKMDFKIPIASRDASRTLDSKNDFSTTREPQDIYRGISELRLHALRTDRTIPPKMTQNFTYPRTSPPHTSNVDPDLNLTVSSTNSSPIETITPAALINDIRRQTIKTQSVHTDNLTFLGPSSNSDLTDKSHYLRTQMDRINATKNFSDVLFAASTNETKKIFIGFLFSTSPRSLKNVFYPWAFKYAIERSNKELLNEVGYRLEPVIRNFTANQILKTQTEFYINGTSAFIGPEDNCAIEARLASAWNLPMIAFKCSDSSVSNHKIYPTFARTSPSTYKVSKSVISLMKYFGWTHYQAVVGNRDTWKEATKSLAKLASENGITMNTDDYITEPFFQVGQKIISKTSKNTRIYIYFGDPEGLIDFVRAMMELFLDNGEYLVIAVREETFDPKKTTKYLMKYYEKLEKSMVDAFVMTLMLFPRTPQETQQYREFKDKMKEYSHQKVYSTYKSSDNAPLTVQLSVYASHLYDAVYVYAKALLACILEGKDPNNGGVILSKIKNSTHESIQGHNIYIDEDGDAEANYTVVALIEDDEDDDDEEESTTYFVQRHPANISKRSLNSKPQKYHKSIFKRAFRRFSNENRWLGVGSHKASLGKNQKTSHRTKKDKPSQTIFDGSGRAVLDRLVKKKRSLDDQGTVTTKSLKRVGHFASNGKDIPDFIYEQEINWISGKVPVSEPECGFDDSKCQIKSAFTTGWPIALICIVFGSMMGTGVIFMTRHYIYEQKVASLLWKIEYKDLLMADPEHEHPLSEKMRGRFGRLSYLSIEESREDSIKRAKHTFTRIASFKGSLVAVKMVKKKHLELTREMKKELHLMREMAHDNVNRFIGACIDLPHVCIVTQYCSRGSLKDILDNEDLHLDDVFIASLVFDLIKGMIFLHDSEIISHGNLNTSNCLVDSRWVLQISDYGLHSLRSTNYQPRKDEAVLWEKLLWKAPELLRNRNSPPRGSQKGDVYSFGLILINIHGRAGPWGSTGMTAKEIVEKIINPSDGWFFRADLSQLKCQDFVVRCIQECTAEEPELRPDFKYIRMRLKPMQEGLSSNIFDNMLAIMEKYANTLETLVDERTFQLAQEKKTTETLLLRMLPKSVAEQLIHGEQVRPEQYECVTIYFSDIVDFTSLSAESTPLEVVDMLNDLYTSFDSIIEAYDVYKVETIGDAYMVVSGLPIRNADNHAGEIASMSLHLLRTIKDFKIRHRPQETLMLRIGIHSGPVVAGVVGLKMPRYCLFGDTVNTASRMESTGESLKIHCSHQSMLLLKKLGGYTLMERGPISVKGKGQVVTYFLIDEDISQRRRRMSVEKPELFFNDLPMPTNLFPIPDEESSRTSCDSLDANDAHQDKTGHGRPNSSNDSSKPHQAEISKLNLININDLSTEILLDDTNLPIVIVTRDQPD